MWMVTLFLYILTNTQMKAIKDIGNAKITKYGAYLKTSFTLKVVSLSVIKKGDRYKHYVEIIFINPKNIIKTINNIKHTN